MNWTRQFRTVVFNPKIGSASSGDSMMRLVSSTNLSSVGFAALDTLWKYEQGRTENELRPNYPILCLQRTGSWQNFRSLSEVDADQGSNWDI